MRVLTQAYNTNLLAFMLIVEVVVLCDHSILKQMEKPCVLLMTMKLANIKSKPSFQTSLVS